MIAQALLRSGRYARERIVATVKHAKKATSIAESTGIKVLTSNADATREADIVILCVKPQQALGVLGQISGVLKPSAIVVSIVTALSSADIEQCVGGTARVVRAMPNTACRVGAGMTALCRGTYAEPDCMSTVGEMFGLMGKTAEVDEQWMDAVTALSASSPAFMYVILEALTDGGVRAGLPRELAALLASQAMFGAASMQMEEATHPALLKGEVTTPGGCTIDGILELEAGGIRATLIRAISTTAAKARQMRVAVNDSQAPSSPQLPSPARP